MFFFGFCLVVIYFTNATTSTVVYIFSDDHIQNCTCPAATDATCAIGGGCNCSSIAENDLVENARTARKNKTILWFNRDTSTLVCCNGLKSNTAATMLRHLLNYVYVKNLTLDHCHELATDRKVTMFGLESLSVNSDVLTTHKKQELVMESTDLTNSSLVYRDHHVIYMHMGVTAGQAPLKAWSLIKRAGNGTDRETPLSRRNLTEMEDRRFMVTYIHL